MAELWPFAAHGPVGEVLEWRTDVLQSAAAEQRLALRAAPHETLTLTHRLDAAGLAQALAIARRGMGSDWIVPLWQMAARTVSDPQAGDTTLAVDTLSADYRAPGFAVLATAGGPAQLVEIAAVRPDGLDLAAPLPAGLVAPVVAPARAGRLLAPLDISRTRAGLATVTARFLLGDPADLSGLRGTALYVAIDTSGSMAGTKIAAAVAAVQALLGELGASVPPVLRNDLCLVLWNATVSGMEIRRDADQADCAALAAWLAASAAAGGGTDFAVALGPAPDFFAGAGTKRRVMLFLTDGEPSPTSSAAAAVALRDTIADLEVFGFNIELANTTWTAMLDTTPSDGVPVIAPGDTGALRDTLLGALFGLPRHLGHDVLIDPSLLRQPLAETLAHPVEAVESGLGPVAFEPLRDLVARGSMITLKDRRPAAAWTRRRWLHRLRGRTGAFWLPSWGRELTLLAPAAPGDTELLVAAGLDPAEWLGRSVLFDLPDGPLIRSITAAIYDALGLRLTVGALDRALPVTTPGHLLTLSRLDTDRIEIDHRPGGAELSLATLEAPDPV